MKYRLSQPHISLLLPANLNNQLSDGVISATSDKKGKKVSTSTR